MELWDDISKTLSTVAETTVKGAEKLTDIAKLKYQIYVEENKLENVYQNMGKLYYEDPENNLPTLKLQRSIAGELIERIEKLKLILAEATNHFTCRSCGEKVGKDMYFCPRCGKKIVKETEGTEV
ncbi:MAG: zinc ribbon domain-containing protein [Ruminococcaceae bacterium]|nr:zinc ribbon domain-containing protein [Oscillospiraceae bacterium]